MEIFATFDDSVFLEAKDRVVVTLSSYNAKVCEPQWFCDKTALSTDDPLEKQKIYKFRGDLAVKQRQHQKALDAYSSCQEWIADNNLTIRRDVLEGMARCCIKLGQKDRALDFADLLSKEASNICHMTSLLLLKVSIYQHFKATASTMSALQQLCSMLPFNPWHWYNLGQTCLHLLEDTITTGSCESLDKRVSDGRAEDKPREAAELNENQIWLKACSCFIRTRLLLRILRQQQSSFVLQRTESTLQTSDQVLRRLSPKESTLQALTEVLSEDVIPDKLREEYQDGDSLASVRVQSFEERWWNKILLTGVLEAEGRDTRTQC
ncbi:uncharacterized protein C8orf76 homolog [Spinachia spinachia]